MFVDSHAHLEGRQYDHDREEVIRRAWDSGVEAILAIGNGNGPGTLDCGIRLAEKYSRQSPVVSRQETPPPSPSKSGTEKGGPPDGGESPVAGRQPSVAGRQSPVASAQPSPMMYATVGIHPHEAKLPTDADFEELAELAKHPKVIAWGEIGLDYFYDHSPREVQREVFLRQLELAKAARLPIIIHCRPSNNSENAWDDCLELLRAHWAPSGVGGIMHCFTGELKHARAVLEMGFMISFAGNVTFPKAQNIRDAAREAPLDRILIETDCPYLAPVPHRGKRNEPAFVKETARQIGELRGMVAEEIGRQTAENFYSFFRLR